MTLTKRLRDGVRRGEITCSVRIWTRPHVTVGGRYKMEEGEIEVDSIEPIGLPVITPELARASGFLGVVDVLKVANHGGSIPPRRIRVLPRSCSVSSAELVYCSQPPVCSAWFPMQLPTAHESLACAWLLERGHATYSG